jgi:hypothetical protein
VANEGGGIDQGHLRGSEDRVERWNESQQFLYWSLKSICSVTSELHRQLSTLHRGRGSMVLPITYILNRSDSRWSGEHHALDQHLHMRQHFFMRPEKLLLKLEPSESDQVWVRLLLKSLWSSQQFSNLNPCDLGRWVKIDTKTGTCGLRYVSR